MSFAEMIALAPGGGAWFGWAGKAPMRQHVIIKLVDRADSFDTMSTTAGELKLYHPQNNDSPGAPTVITRLDDFGRIVGTVTGMEAQRARTARVSVRVAHSCNITRMASRLFDRHRPARSRHHSKNKKPNSPS
jgi:hypothetical protein